MATFQIYQDAEKENPQNHGNIAGAPMGILKERKAAGVGLNSKNAATGQAQTRSNFSVLNIYANEGFAGGKLLKVKQALRETGNTKTGGFITGKETVAAAIIKGNKNVINSNANKATTTTITINQQQEQQITKSINHEEINILTQLEFERHHHEEHHNIQIENDEKTISTPMSVSDMFSPMSVDRSNIVSLDTSLDKENQPNLLQHLQHKKSNESADDSCTLNISTDEINASSPAQSEQQQCGEQQQDDEQKNKLKESIKYLPPRNDRQRFFEVVEYQDAILEYFREGEKKHRPKSHYMRRQPDINYSMRTILVDWLVEVSEEYNLDTETLYLSISYIDRFLSHMSVVRSKLQLVGTAAMYIAAKYEEIYPPDVGEFVFITDDTYTKAQVLRMEQLILKILAFDLCTPTPYVFVNTYAVLTDMTNELKFLTMYISELSLLEAEPYLRYVPSIISAASHALARYILDYSIWSAHLEEVTTYRLEDLKEVVLNLCQTHNAAASLPQQAIQEKYKTKKYNEVSTLKSVELTAEKFDEITFEYNETIAAEKARLEREQAEASANNENVRRMISLMFN